LVKTGSLQNLTFNSKIYMKNFFCFVVIFMLCIVGCTNNNSMKITPASGVLTQNGKPLADVRIEFRKIDTGSLSFAETDSQGRFKLVHTHGKNGAEIGKYLVSIFRKSKPLPVPAGQPTPSEPQMTPEEQISMTNQTPIEIEIKESGTNEFVIDIK
jgi:hypothetical protein